MKKGEIRFYNLLLPIWLLMAMPIAWLIVVPGNFIIDSAVLLMALAVLKLPERKICYKKYILKVYLFGFLADFAGAALMFLLLWNGVGNLGDEWYLTLPGLLFSAALIFVLNYFITFRDCEKGNRWKLALILTVATAPYTFLIPSGWIYT